MRKSPRRQYRSREVTSPCFSMIPQVDWKDVQVIVMCLSLKESENYEHMKERKFLWVYVWVCIYVCMYVYVCMYGSMYVCMYVCMYVWIYIYIHICLQLKHGFQYEYRGACQHRARSHLLLGIPLPYGLPLWCVSACICTYLYVYVWIWCVLIHLYTYILLSFSCYCHYGGIRFILPRPSWAVASNRHFELLFRMVDNDDNGFIDSDEFAQVKPVLCIVGKLNHFEAFCTPCLCMDPFYIFKTLAHWHT